MLKLDKIIKNIAKIPQSPGVYIFRNREKVPIYVGKSVNLRKRLVSHFTKKGKSFKIFSDSYFIDFKEVETEIEALLLEADLIKHFRPKYNAREKDDKSFLYLVIRKADFSYLEFIREKNLNLKSGDLSFGPFIEGQSLKEAIKFLRQIFHYRDCRPLVFGKAKKENHPCLYYSLGKCSAPCIQGAVGKKEYQKMIRELILFLKNKKSRLIKKWQKEMQKLSIENKFEQAATIRDRLKAIERLKRLHFIEDSVPRAKRKIRIEIYDVAQIFGEGKSGGMVVYEGVLDKNNKISGQFNKNEFRRFRLKEGKDDLSLLSEMVKRRFKHTQWNLPDLILVDGGENQVRTIKKIMQIFMFDLPVVGITKNKKHKVVKPTLPQDRFKWPYLYDLVKKNWLLFIELDERSHQFSQNYFRMQRKKKLFE